MTIKKKKNSKKSGRLCFPGTRPFKLKKDEDFSRDISYDLESEPILKNVPGLGFISTVPLDYIHLILLGVVKRLISLWIIGPINKRLKSAEVHQISEKILKLRHSCPLEFSRKPRKFSDYLHWKATKFRTFLLYAGPIVLKNIVSPEIYSHFILLHCAVTILVNKNHLKIQSNIDYAEELLNEFVKDFSDVYGKEYVTQNVHNLLYICTDVRKFGSLDSFSAFPFENFLFSIKKLITKGEKLLQQIAMRYAEIERIIEKRTPSTGSAITLKQQHFNVVFLHFLSFFLFFSPDFFFFSLNLSSSSCSHYSLFFSTFIFFTFIYFSLFFINCFFFISLLF